MVAKNKQPAPFFRIWPRGGISAALNAALLERPHAVYVYIAWARKKCKHGTRPATPSRLHLLASSAHAPARLRPCFPRHARSLRTVCMRWRNALVCGGRNALAKVIIRCTIKGATQAHLASPHCASRPGALSHGGSSSLTFRSRWLG